MSELGSESSKRVASWEKLLSFGNPDAWQPLCLTSPFFLDSVMGAESFWFSYSSPRKVTLAWCKHSLFLPAREEATILEYTELRMVTISTRPV